jgi:hypothetical protein
MIGGRTRTRTLDPLIKSHQITLINQAHFDISSVRSGIEPERKLENVEAKSGVAPYKQRFDFCRKRLYRESSAIDISILSVICLGRIWDIGRSLK